MTMINRRDAAKALGGAVLAGASSVIAGPSTSAHIVDPVVALWAQVQAIDAECDRISAEQGSLRDRIISRRPGNPRGVPFEDWHRGDPDLARCTALCERSDELNAQVCDLYDEIAVTVATTPEGVRAKAAAALSLCTRDPVLRKGTWYHDLLVNALREAAAGSASA